MSKLSIYSEDEVASFFSYLDGLRKSGVTNMFGSPTYLVEHFGLSTAKAKEIVVIWMMSFDERVSAAKRAQVVWMANQ